MASEIAGAVQSIRLLMDVIKANKSLTNFNELVAAVSEVNAELLSAQAMALTSQKNEMTLTKRVSELEKEIAEAKDWNREAEGYTLTEIVPSIPAYILQSEIERSAITHRLCANCFSDHKKSFLQRGPAKEWGAPAVKDSGSLKTKCRSQKLFARSNALAHLVARPRDMR